MTIALTAKDVPMSVYINSDEKVGLGLLREYAEEIRRATPAGTQVVVLPEKIVRVSEEALPEVDAMFSAAAAAAHSAIDLGIVRRTASGSYNSARFYSATGRLEANYDKQHLIPGIEPERPGDKRVVLRRPSGNWGLQICKDLDFPALSREYAADGTTCCSCRRGISRSTGGCTRGWRCCARWRTGSPWRAPDAMGCSP